MATEEQLKKALVQAHNAGDTQAANLFAQKIKDARQQAQLRQVAPQEQAVLNTGASINPEVPAGGAGMAFPEQPQQPDPTLGEIATGTAEALATLGTGATTGALGFLGGGVLGAGGELTGLVDDGQQLALEGASLGTFEPKTEFGRELVADIGELLGVLPPVMGGAPVQSARVAAIPPAKTLQTLSKTSRAGKRVVQNISKTKKALAEEIKAGNRNAGNIAMQLDADGTLIKNPNMKKAIDLMGNGDDAYNLALDFERMGKGTKKKVNLILDELQKNKDIGGRKQTAMNRPALIIGKSIEDRILKLRDLNNKASKRIGELINSEQGNNKVNVKAPLSKFIDELGESRIRVGVDEGGRLKLDLSKTTSNARTALDEQQLSNILTELASPDLTAKEAHGLKRDLRQMVSYDARPIGAAAPSDQITKAIKNLSSELSNAVGREIDGYKKANNVMSNNFEALKMTDRMLGKSLGIGQEGSVVKLTSVANKVATNYPSRTDMPILVKALDEALKKQDIKFADDVVDLTFAMMDIEDIFKLEQSQASRGLTGRMLQGGLTAADLASGSTVTTSQKLLDISTDLFNKMPVKEFDDKMKAIRALSKVKDNE